MKHLAHPRTDIKSMCGLPFGGWRKDGKRHRWLSYRTFHRASRVMPSERRPSERVSNSGVPVGVFKRR